MTAPLTDAQIQSLREAAQACLTSIGWNWFTTRDTAKGILALLDEREELSGELKLKETGLKIAITQRDALRAERDAAREFVKRHPSLTLIDLAEFEAFLKVPAAIDAALTTKGTAE